MSNLNERDGVGELLLREWAAFVGILAERGETWQTTDPATWPQSSALWAADHGIRVLMEAGKLIGVHVDRAELNQQHEERAAYRRMFPDGAPRL